MIRTIRWSTLLVAACATQGGAAPVAPPECTPTLPDVVAVVGGEAVTRDQLMDFAAAEIVAAEVAAHEARTNALETLIMQRLLEAEADRLGVAPEDLVRQQVDDQISPPTDDEIAAFYAENQPRMPGSFDEMQGQIANYLMQDRATALLRTLVGGLEAKTSIERNVDPYRVAVDAGDSPRWGSPEAPIQIVEFSDFQCGFCTMGAETMREVQEKYGDQVSVVYRHFPLRELHPQASRAAEAAQCAHEQDAFWGYHDALFAAPKAWSDDDYVAIAKTLKLKKKPFRECLDSGRHSVTVAEDIDAGRRGGMNGTPGYYVNGIVLSGAQSIDIFADIIDRELARSEP